MDLTSKKLVNIGFVGGGFMGQLAHMANYREIPGCRLAALSELRPKLRELVAKQYGIQKTYASHEEMLRDPDLDAVVVVTTRPMLGPIALDCLRAGKHVLTEKPMAASLTQAESLVVEADQQGVNYAVGYMKRHDDGVRKAKQLLTDLRASGELGAINYVRVHNFMGDTYCNIDGTGNIKTNETVPMRPEWPSAPDWLPEEKKSDYSWFLNAYCHDINLVRYLIGATPQVKCAQLSNRNGQAAMLAYNDFTCLLETGQFDYHHWDEIIEVYFEHGRLRLACPAPMLRNVSASVSLYKAGAKEEINWTSDWTWAFRRQADAFVRDIQQNRRPQASGADALKDMKLAEDLWKCELEMTTGPEL